jgi:cell division inhibitor SepF
MKGIWNKLDAILGGDLDDDDDAYYDDSYPSDDDDDIDITPTPTPTRSGSRGEKVVERSPRPSNVKDFYADRTYQEAVTFVQIVRPKVIEDATFICDHLQENKICIINMVDAEPNMAQRIADWLAGVCYALNGQVERIDNYIFVMAPESAKISSDLMTEIKGGLFKSFK